MCNLLTLLEALTGIFRVFVFASSVFGRVIVNTPLSKWASILSVLTFAPRPSNQSAWQLPRGKHAVQFLMGPRKIREKLIYINADTCDWPILSPVIQERTGCDELSPAL